MRAVIAGLVAVVVGFGMGVPEAEAKRLGGGASFGGKKSFSEPQKRSATQSPSKQDANKNDAAAPTAGTAAGTAGAAAAAKPGMGGMLAGLAAGGLLAALFFGGAFENISFLDILIFGLLAFLLFKLLAGRRRGMEPQPAGGPYVPPGEDYQAKADTATTQQRTAQGGFNTDLLFNKNRPAASIVERSEFGAEYAGPIPKDFGKQDFLEGAKNAFARLQHAWDVGDLGDLRQFTTDKVFGEIQDQYRAREGENRTEILNLDATLLNVQEQGAQLEAVVLFAATLREIDVNSGENPEPVAVEEVWHFVKPRSSVQPTWYLDGIQQVED